MKEDLEWASKLSKSASAPLGAHWRWAKVCESAGEEPSGVRPVSAATAPRSLLERGAPCRGGGERLAGRGGGRGPCSPGLASAGCSLCSEVAGSPPASAPLLLQAQVLRGALTLRPGPGTPVEGTACPCPALLESCRGPRKKRRQLTCPRQPWSRGSLLSETSPTCCHVSPPQFWPDSESRDGGARLAADLCRPAGSSESCVLGIGALIVSPALSGVERCRRRQRLPEASYLCTDFFKRKRNQQVASPGVTLKIPEREAPASDSSVSTDPHGHRGGKGKKGAMARSDPSASPSLLLLLLAQLVGRAAAASKAPVCQEITVPMCRGIGYNLTHMPNQFNHDTQDEAGLEVHQFWPLVEIHCSPDLRFFLCSMYTPICLPDYHKPLPPCRSVCERAKAGCSPLMRQYGFAWPERMSCDRLPVLGGDAEVLCMDYNRSEATTTSPKSFPAKPTLPGPPGAPSSGGECPSGGPSVCTCREPFVPILKESHPLYNKVRTGQVPNCAVPCYQPSFSPDERTFATFWIGLWSVLCFISTSTTVATFLIDMERFRYPERPIIFLSACYLCVSLGFLVRLVVGHASVACSREHSHIHYETTGPALCTVVFLLVYFFGMASSIWWVILSLTWFLAAGMKWGNEAIAGYAQYFHLAAWLIPSVKSITALALSSVDGDPVAGICYVGNQNLNSLRGFVLGPLVLYLLVGTLFLLAGFVSLFRIRSVIKQGGTKTDKLEKLMIRIGIFTLLYTVPASIVVACYLYEQHYRESWEAALTCTCPGPDSGQPRAKPEYWVLMLKYFMCLVVGITSGVWIWSGKTLESWRRFTSRCCCSSGRGHKSGGAMAAGDYAEASAALTGRTGPPGPAAAAYHKQVSLSHV